MLSDAVIPTCPDRNRETRARDYAESTVRARSADRVKKEIRAPASLLTSLPIVDPGMRVLMHEQRHADSRDITIPA